MKKQTNKKLSKVNAILSPVVAVCWLGNAIFTLLIGDLARGIVNSIIAILFGVMAVFMIKAYRMIKDD